MKEIVLATRNRHKIVELKSLFQSLPIPIKSLEDFPEFPEEPEDGKSFEENAAKKALSAARALALPCLADDSGLEVDALNKRPGIYSARYAKTNPERIARLLGEMKNVPPEKRSARFVSAMTLALPDGNLITKTGYCYGMIADAARGTGGFGYDPVFILPDPGKTMAELALEEKNQVSHRGQAARLMIPAIQAILSRFPSPYF